MNISGIRASAGFYDYNDIKSSEARSRQIREAKAVEEDEVSSLQEAGAEQILDSEEQSGLKVEKEATQKFTSYDYAKQYEPDATYEMKGGDSEIGLLDINKVLSEVRKDSVLQQYQFFVGEVKAQKQEGTRTPQEHMLNFEL